MSKDKFLVYPRDSTFNYVENVDLDQPADSANTNAAKPLDGIVPKSKKKSIRSKLKLPKVWIFVSKKHFVVEPRDAIFNYIEYAGLDQTVVPSRGIASNWKKRSFRSKFKFPKVGLFKSKSRAVIHPKGMETWRQDHHFGNDWLSVVEPRE